MADLTWYYGDPFSDSSALVTYALSRETRRSVTVALTGDGADETLLGYARYFSYGDMRRSTPPRGGRRIGELYLPAPAGDDTAVLASDAYGYKMERLRERQKLIGYGIAMLPYLGYCSYERLLPYYVAGLTPEEMAARFDQGTYLPDNLLVKVDIAAMAHGLETRAPFLNHELAEWIGTIPTDRKIWDREGKALLKSALVPLLPHDCMYRTKVGFRVPVAKFMAEEAYDQTSELLGERFGDRGILRMEFVQQMLEDHHTRKEDHGPSLWSLVCLEMWFRTWIDSDSNECLKGDDDPFAVFGEHRNASVDLQAPSLGVEAPLV
jgi:asparagine synthase (glutamine-hydrolysing)